MTALEKASQLIVDYQLSVRSLDYDEAVQCSIRTVNEIIDSHHWQYLKEGLDYWQEVRGFLKRQLK